MVTLFAIPKAFRGHTGVIQRNAIGSWARLGTGSRVVLFGDEEGTAEVARESHVDHVPEVARNEFGTPLVSSLFHEARKLAAHDGLCYVNSDVILLGDFLPAIERVRIRTRRFLMVGECWNLHLRTPVPFDDPSWQAEILRQVSESAVRRGSWYIDYFVFSRDLYHELPPFAVGRAGFDNWLVWKARALGATVVDASRVVTAVHQQHDYSHVRGGREWSYSGPEAVRNVQLAGGREHLYRIDHASHVLTSRGLRRQLGRWARFEYHWEAWLGQVTWLALEATRPVRHRLGLRAATFRRIRSLVTRWSGKER
jgi:hypothetical protein